MASLIKLHQFGQYFDFKIKIGNFENLFNERRVYEFVDNMSLS